MKKSILKALAIFGKFLLLILIWSGGIAIVSNFDKNIQTLGKVPSSFLFEFLPLIFILIPSLLLWKFLEKKEFTDFGFSTSNFSNNLWKGFTIGLVWISLAIFGICISCKVQTNFNIDIGIATLFAYFVILLINTIMQEVLCRGYLYNLIENSYNSNYAIITTSIFFVLLHPGAVAAGIVGILNVFCAGLIFAYTRKITKTLWMPITIHIVWNFIDSILVGTSPLGMYPSLKWLKITGTTVFTGGKDGLGASLVTIFTFPILFLIFYYDVFKIQNKSK
jgi:uncharacterized protein